MTRQDRSSMGRLRDRVPKGMMPVTIAVGISGVAAYVFLTVEARTLGPARYAPLAAYWSLVFLVGPGIFSGVESETSRQLSAGRATGDRRAPIVQRTFLVAMSLCVVLAVIAGACINEVRSLFDGEDLLVAGLFLSFGAFCLEFTGLGVAAGNRLFKAYAAIVAGEAVFRLLIALAYDGTIGRSVGAAGLAIAVSPVLALLVALPLLRSGTLRGPDTSVTRLFRSSPSLIGSVLLANVLVSAGPVLVKGLANTREQQVTAASFLAALLLVRVPLFLFNATAPVLLPALASAVAAGDWHRFARVMTRLLVGILAGGLLLVVGALTLGPSLLHLLFGPAYGLPADDVAVLAASVVFLIAASSIGTALTAMHMEHKVVVGWVAGCASMAAVTAAVPSLVARVAYGILCGSGTVAVLLGVVLASALSSRTGSTSASRALPA